MTRNGEKGINRIRLEFKGRSLSPAFWNAFPVLIESDWNLKHIIDIVVNAAPVSINRIRLEFKVMKVIGAAATVYRINRIRLEFKDEQDN